MKVKNESEVVQSCSTLRNPMDCSLPGSSIHGIFQARVLEWVVIAFSNLRLNIKKKKKTKIMASGPMTSWQIEGEKVEVVTDLEDNCFSAGNQ